jgi:ubiquinone/menaquinone biosynthesis C-methylase UbiE
VTPPTTELARAYDRTGATWERGPARLVYDRLARVLVERSPVPLAGRLVLDVGAGTGAAGRSILAAGGTPVAVDVSAAMLRANPGGARRAIVGDATQLALAAGCVDGLVAAFSFNHLDHPSAGFREALRVCRSGSPVLVAAYASDDTHPVKQAVEQALVEAGWAAAAWYEVLRRTVAAQLSTPARMTAAARTAGLVGRSDRMEVDLADLDADDLVTWRLGMASAAPFLAGLDASARHRVRSRARQLLGDERLPLRRSIVAFAGVT